MHPVIHLALKQFLEARYGVKRWIEFLERAGVTTTLPYVHLGPYPDEELTAIVATAADLTGTPAEELLEDFGAATAPNLISMYPRLIRPEWGALDLICNTEATIHEIVRKQHPAARPAFLRCERPSPTEVVITYTSGRRLCALARGIIRGVAQHFGETLTVAQPACMLRGDPACQLVVRTAGRGGVSTR